MLFSLSLRDQQPSHTLPPTSHKTTPDPIYNDSMCNTPLIELRVLLRKQKNSHRTALGCSEGGKGSMSLYIPGDTGLEAHFGDL